MLSSFVALKMLSSFFTESNISFIASIASSSYPTSATWHSQAKARQN